MSRRTTHFRQLANQTSNMEAVLSFGQARSDGRKTIFVSEGKREAGRASKLIGTEPMCAEKQARYRKLWPK